MTAPFWKNCPIAFYRIPACPYCGSAGRITVRTTTERDGSITRNTRCRECSRSYVLVLELDEPPTSGSEAFPAE
jgi:hypothetical protein